MLQLKYLKCKTSYEVDFIRISENIVEIQGDFPIKSSGFTLSRLDRDDEWDYSDFKTVYRTLENGVQFSNDESVYIEPEPTPDLPDIPFEPYVPTLENVKKSKLNEISRVCEQTIYKGIDVELSGKLEHFSLTEKDQINLFGKQAQIDAGIEKIEYHSDGNLCKYYDITDMKKIIMTATSFKTYHTTYCNSLNMWIKSLENVDDIQSITYGCEIPNEFWSEVLSDIYATINV